MGQEGPAGDQRPNRVRRRQDVSENLPVAVCPRARSRTVARRSTRRPFAVRSAIGRLPDGVPAFHPPVLQSVFQEASHKYRTPRNILVAPGGPTGVARTSCAGRSHGGPRGGRRGRAPRPTCPPGALPSDGGTGVRRWLSVPCHGREFTDPLRSGFTGP